MSFESRNARSFGMLLLIFVAPMLAFFLSGDYAAEIAVLIWLAVALVFLFTSTRLDRRTELTGELAGVRYGPVESSALERSVEEARKTLDAQLTNLNDIDETAVRILRTNVLSIGFLFSALALSASTDVAPFGRFLNTYVGTGLFLLLSSTAMAGVTYTASDFRAGMSEADVVRTLEGDLTAEQLELALSKNYAKWIAHNRSTEALNTFYSTSTVLLLIYAVAYLSLGVYNALVEPVPFLLEGGCTVLLLALTLASGYPSQAKRVLNEIDVTF